MFRFSAARIIVLTAVGFMVAAAMVAHAVLGTGPPPIWAVALAPLAWAAVTTLAAHWSHADARAGRPVKTPSAAQRRIDGAVCVILLVMGITFSLAPDQGVIGGTMGIIAILLLGRARGRAATSSSTAAPA